MSEKSVSDILDNLISNLEVLSISAEKEWTLKDEDNSLFKQTFFASIQELHDTSAKFVMIFRGKQNAKDVGTYGDNVERSALLLLNSWKQFSQNFSPFIKKYFNSKIKQTIQSLSNLALSIKHNIDNDIKVNLGKVWENCEELKKVNFDSPLRYVVMKQLKSDLSLLRNALEDLNSEIESFQDNEENEESEEGDIDDLDNQYSENEKKVLTESQNIVKTAIGFSKQLILLFEKTKETNDDWIMDIYEHSKKITEYMDDFVSSLIEPPLSKEELLESSSKIKSTIFNILEKLILNDDIKKLEEKLMNLKSTIDKFFIKYTSEIETIL